MSLWKALLIGVGVSAAAWLAASFWVYHLLME